MSNNSSREEAIFQQAVGCASETERAAFLEQACQGNAALRDRLELLLEGYFKADGFLGREPESQSASNDEPIGTVIGRYRLLEQVGEGGFGVVYVAEQKEPVKRHVALKIVKLGMDTKQVVARFEAERQALALMNHPNIANVHDGGGTPGGRPYFVMELVRGVPITKYCDEHQLSIRERLELFVQVCQAVQHAHQKGIIHRDLKPSNILVALNDGVAVPKVIDFGVAKATQQELTEKTIFTQFHHLIGTPAYMSPEQAEMTSEDIDTRSDIYSLGVLLYELLTGKTPFDGKELFASGLDDMRRTIRHKEPLKPSTRLARERAAVGSGQSPIGNRKSPIDPDLDWIVMKCLEKDRGRRYETANGLAADVRRYLSSEPVVARPPTASYRIRKFARRNRTASIAAALVAIVVLLGAIISTWALLGERAARAEAEERLRSALRFVDDIFNNVAPDIRRMSGAVNAREKLGEASLAMLQELRRNAANNPAVQQALVNALIYLSETQGSVGEGNVVGNFESALARAREAVELLRATPFENLSGKQLESLVVARHLVSTSLRGLGRYDEAVQVLQESEPLLNRLEEIRNFRQWARRRRFGNLSEAGHYLTLSGRPRDGLAYLLASLNTRLAQAITTNSEPNDIEMLGNTYGQLTSAHLLLQQYEAMTDAAEKCLILQEVLVQRFPENVRHLGCLAATRANCGYGLICRGRSAEALELLKQSRQAIDHLVDKNPANYFPRVWRAYIAMVQARAFAAWSVESSASRAERRQRLAQAERYLVEAEAFHRGLKDKAEPVYLNRAREEVAAAKAKLEPPAYQSLP